MGERWRVGRLVAWFVEWLSALRSCYVYLNARGKTNFQSQCREVVEETGDDEGKGG